MANTEPDPEIYATHAVQIVTGTAYAPADIHWLIVWPNGFIQSIGKSKWGPELQDILYDFFTDDLHTPTSNCPTQSIVWTHRRELALPEETT